MFEDEPDNPEQGTDNVTPQADDTAKDWDYFDPDEDQDTEEVTETDAPDDGTAPVEEAEATEEPAEIEATVDAVVTVNGQKMKVKDLISGHLRQEDYSRKTQEVANHRKAVEADAQRLEGITKALVDHLEKLVPPAPDHTVALRDPAKYTRDMAIHQAAMAQLAGLIELGQAPKAVQETMAKEDLANRAREENARLVERFPALTNPQERGKFFSEAVEAANELGFSRAELEGVMDHRIFAALNLAAKGLKATQAMQAAQKKVVKAPPMAPQRPPAAKAGNRDAMNKLARSGSLRDALKVDWE